VKSFGSTSIVPIAFRSKGELRYVQVGVGAIGSSVRQMPPPAVPTQSRQNVVLQTGEIAIAGVRDAGTYGAPEKFRTPGCVGVVGPYGCQVPSRPGFGVLGVLAARRAKVPFAVEVHVRGIARAGYLSWRYL
jgi:hypothetical protein